jgi:hypothetical protein
VPNVRPALGILRPVIVAALRADNAWRIAHGLPLAWDILTSADTSENIPPYITFAPALANGTPAARTQALAETLERWRAAANGESADIFSCVIGGTRWRAEWFDVFLAPGGALHVDGCDPLSVLEMSHDESGYVFSMERSACALFGVVRGNLGVKIGEISSLFFLRLPNTRRPVNHKLKNDDDTHEEKGAGGAKFDPTPEPPQAQVVQGRTRRTRLYTRRVFLAMRH